jgi:hypothetical protein
MGYSCTRDANETLERIQARFGIDNSGNVYSVAGKIYFWERGRENADGAITGKVHRFDSYSPTGDNSTAHPAGSFRIAPDGAIIRFPGLPRKEAI